MAVALGRENHFDLEFVRILYQRVTLMEINLVTQP